MIKQVSSFDELFGKVDKDKSSSDIEWSCINYSVPKKQILSGCSGLVKSGQVCAIMGPSGSGKSSLLNVLAGRSTPGAGIDIKGTIKVGGTIINPIKFKTHIAYVMQDDHLMATATPREALRFSASLRLPSSTSSNDIDQLVDATISELGLDDCADVLIGGALIKGISGGQRKRTSIGVELISNPSLLFLDEPTSGLDSYSAYNCIQLLKKIAMRNAAVLCTIHQPSSEVFALFDTVIFMKEGRVLYSGNVSDMTGFFSKRGFTCPDNYNVSDYIMFINQTETSESLEKKGFFLKNDIEESKADNADNSITAVSEEDILPAVTATFYRQCKELTLREALNTQRDIAALIGRFGITIFLNLLFGLIFYGIGGKDNAVQENISSHFGAVTFTIISSMFGAAQPIMLMFPFERPLFLREYSTGTYGVVPYFISKILLELPLTFIQTVLQFILVYYLMDLQGNFILLVLETWMLSLASSSVAMGLGAAVSNVKDVTELAPLLFVPQLLFAGFFIRTSQIPLFLRWAQYLCSIKYTINLVLLTEFNSQLPSCQGAAAANCASVINSNDIVGKLWWVYVLLLLALFVGFRLIAAAILIHKAKKFF